MELVIKIIIMFAISAVIYYGVPLLTMYQIFYWAALLISFVITFGGFLLLDGDILH